MAPPNPQRKRNYKARHKLQTSKVLDRLTYVPKKHKQKQIKDLRQQLQKKEVLSKNTSSPPTKLKFGSFNVNGLDLEACWAIQELLEKRGFDVSYKSETKQYKFKY